MDVTWSVSYEPGISNEEREVVGDIEASGDGISESKVNEVGDLEGKMGISFSEVGKAENIKSESNGIFKSEVRSVKSIKSGQSSIRDSKVGEVLNLAQPQYINPKSDS